VPVWARWRREKYLAPAGQIINYKTKRSPMNIVAAGFAEKLAPINQTTQHRISADINLQSHHRKNVTGSVSFETPHLHQDKDACGF
jgi:hypothetical protein